MWVLHFVDVKQVRVFGGNGGDGCISFLSLWCNENAGPDGGDGGNGGHVVFKSTYDVNNLGHITSVIRADNGEKGYPKDCVGKNAKHNIVPVPVGTIIKNVEGKIVGDLDVDGLMFIAARGGSGGKGNPFFVTDAQNAPKICEYGATGEQRSYTLELRSMAHIGLIGLPNAGKSTLLQAITRARSKIASYPFTTLKPHLGMVQYDDYVQIAIADLPGLIPGSHENKGLGIQFLKHIERCTALLFIVDASSEAPWEHIDALNFELKSFSKELATRPQVIVANKIDLPEAMENVRILEEKLKVPIITISAKMGTNVANLLAELRKLYDKIQSEKEAGT
ncbi:Mitochondrial ribosome-associated GTPase 2 [Pseudolycoriella hygida]|uniref:Mitochondrial ribosome-associated GTPase 2 n=1 Tax=Pseudolycoriella hygida TaxID=35572 RepID=A0A9Q0NBV1_9DIPT|nr:Mitochondrial ribosome-associated GTPase 2 [Pseudolycoriella hygida]